MSLRLIIGRAGSGKTNFAFSKIKESLLKNKDGSKIILLVPEQATFQNEMQLVSDNELNGIMRAEVLSFHRLAWRALQETGGGCRVHIGELGKHMIIRQILEKREEDLKVFAGAVNRLGFIDVLASVISELKLYKIETEKLSKIVAKHNKESSLLISKLEDLSLVYEDLEDFLQNRYLDPDNYLDLLAEKACNSPTVKDSEIWIDGFTGFTPQELNVIAVLLKTASRVNVCLTLDKNELSNGNFGPFKVTGDTYKKILKLADICNIEVEKEILLENQYRFHSSYSLGYLEKNFFNINARACLEKNLGVNIICAQNHRAEVEAIAREIRTLCREKGLRYNEIGVLLRDFSHYDQLVETIFADYEIPVFMDRKRMVMHHPLVELIRSSLEVVLERWSYEAVFRYLKTDLTSLTREEVDLLENYVLARGIKGKSWYNNKPWRLHVRYKNGQTIELSPEEEKLNSIRAIAIFELLAFQEKIVPAKNAEEFAQAVFQLLMDLKVNIKLEEWAEEAVALGLLEQALEHSQIWNGIIDILDQAVEIIGEEELEINSFAKILEAGLAGLKLGLIPPGLDQVVVGSLERSRNPNLRAALVLGVGDGILPARPRSEGIFDDIERESIKELGLELSPSSRDKVLDEELLVYTALTRAGEYLFLSYPLADQDGKALRPSMVIRRVKELFVNMEEKYLGVEPQENNSQDLTYINHSQRALAFLATKLRKVKEGQEVHPLWWDVYNVLLTDEKQQNNLKKVVDGLFFTNKVQPLSSVLSRKLYANPLRLSVSRLEQFNACPFSHFVNYGLKLKEREVYKLKSPDLGQFFHSSLETFGKKLAERQLDWAELEKKQILELTEEVVEEIIPNLQNEILLSSSRYVYLAGKFKKTVQRAALVLREHARRGKFRPLGLEIAFGPTGQLPALKLTLQDGSEMELVGRIDRIDGAINGNRCFLRVIDYKSGSADLSLLEVFYGLKLQLLAYLEIALKNSHTLIGSDEAVPAGISYFYLKDPLINAEKPMTDFEIEENIIKELKLQGLSLADVEVFQLIDMETKQGWSPIISVALNKYGAEVLEDGGSEQKDINQLECFHKNSQVVDLEQINYLKKYTQDFLKKSASELLRGQAAISPYQLKNKNACSYCSFQAVCHFDFHSEENIFRRLRNLDEKELWRLLQKT